MTTDRALPCLSLMTPGDGDPAYCFRGHPLHAAACVICPDYAVDARERTRCEVWTRVMGYHRPVGAFNIGKQAEHRERVAFREPAASGADATPTTYTYPPAAGYD